MNSLRAFTLQIRAVMWGDEIDLCPDALYMRLTGRESLEEYREISKLQSGQCLNSVDFARIPDHHSF